MDNPKYQKFLRMIDPIPVSGKVLIQDLREVQWRNICLIGEDARECIVEFSFSPLRLYIVVLDLEWEKYHVE
jgi:hypothetical protein